MKNKNSRLDSIKMIISSKEIGSQDELLQELTKEGFQLTQATLSRVPVHFITTCAGIPRASALQMNVLLPA